DVLLDGHNNVYIYDFTSDTVTTPYKKAMKSMEVKTMSEGRSEILPNGDVFIEEQNHGRILRLTPDTAKWEFVRRVDKDHLSLVSWSRYLNEEQAQKVLSKLQNGSHN
ncbi:MAG: arylsulfotransferase family protein, partial [Patescibacteria group bacterium]